MPEYIKIIMKFQRSLLSDMVFMTNEKGNISGQLPMDTGFRLLFGSDYVVYCECDLGTNDHILTIGKRVRANF